MRVPVRRISALCLAAAVACGGGSGGPGNHPDLGTSEQTTPPGAGTPTPPAPPPPSDPGTSGGTTAPPDPGTPPEPPPPPPAPPPPAPPSAPTYGVRIDCAPVNDFGYIGWAKGDLAIGARTADGALAVTGTLKVRYKFIDGPETDRDVQVEGTVEKSGEYLMARVVSGADDLESVFFVLSANSPFSAINGVDGSPAYQTQCGASSATLPHGSDLLPDGGMSFQPGLDQTVEVHVHVVNAGDQSASGAAGRATVGAVTSSAELHRATDGAGAAPSTLGPGEHGYVRVVIPKEAVARCQKVNVVVDVDHTFQSGAPDPFANDAAQVATPCLTWSRPISSEALGFDPDPFLAGKTLGNIVGGSEVGRKDGYLCSHCHYSGSGNAYSPPVTADGSATILPTDMIGGTTWAAPGGFAERFLTNPINKPDYLKAVVKRWLDDGARP